MSFIESKKKRHGSFRHIWPNLGRYRIWTLAAAIFGGLEVMLEVLIPMLMSVIVDGGLYREQDFMLRELFPEALIANRDRFVLSKGHAAPCYYGVLAEKGFFSRDEFKNFRQLHSILQGHPDCKKVPGIDASTGSLGQGCSIAVGMALGAKLQGKDTKVFAMLGDGECQEGQIWEALMSAAHYKLDNLTVIVDNNGLQIDGSNNEVMSLGDLAAKLRAFGFDLYEIDGHDLDAIEAALSAPVTAGKPKAILAHTVKGKGISFMENQVGWHGKAPNEEQRQQALKELED